MLYAANFSDEVTNLVGGIVSIALKVVIFLVIMLLGWLIATWLHTWITRSLQRLGFDRAVERGGLHRMLGRSSASDLTARLVVFAFGLFVLQLAFGIFGPNPVSDLIASVIAWLPRLFAAIVIIVVAAAVASWVKELVAEAIGGLDYGRAIATTAQGLIIAIGVIAALNQIGIGLSVTLPVLVAVLATVGGILVVGVGGGLIKPMQHRWERILHRAEIETTLIRTYRANVRMANAASAFDQQAYGPRRPEDVKASASDPGELGREM